MNKPTYEELERAFRIVIVSVNINSREGARDEDVIFANTLKAEDFAFAKSVAKQVMAPVRGERQCK